MQEYSLYCLCNILPLPIFTYLSNSVQQLLSFFSIDLKMFCVHFLANSSCFASHFSSSRYCCPNILILYAFLTFNFNFFTYCSIQDQNFSHYFTWNKSFCTLEYYVLEINPYLPNTSAFACSYCKFIPQEGL
jgi:hypothetical protein